MKCPWNGYPNLVVQKPANRFVGFGLIRLSACGPERTFFKVSEMSAFGSRADITFEGQNVRL